MKATRRSRALVLALAIVSTLVAWGPGAVRAAATGDWWGIDTTDNLQATNDLAQSAATIGTPQFAARYLIFGGGGSLTAGEAQYLHSVNEPILLLSSPANGILTGAVTGTAEAQAAITQAHSLGVGAGTAIFRDVETTYPIDAAYIAAWYLAFQGSGYVPGLYENPENGQFPGAYCAAVSANSAVGTGTALYSSEPEFLYGDPHRLAQPGWRPLAPPCANMTVAWQYEERGLFPSGLVAPNVDVDEFLPAYGAMLWGQAPPPPPEVTQIYGQTADATVAREFEAAYPVVNATGGNADVVLTTDADPYDALSASYLEARLNTGLLITPVASLGTDAQAALRQEGVSTVYVVGGPLAISPSVITQLENTPAYQPGGVTMTGSNIQVAAGSSSGGSPGAIYGQTADDTAQDLATYFPSGNGTATFSGAFTANGIGMYNDTTGNGSGSGPASAVPTAIIVSDSSFQDAVSAGPLAYANDLPVLLTPGNPATSLGSQASSALSALGIKQVIVIGGPLAINDSVVTAIQGSNGGISVLRVAGQDATDTSSQLANFLLAAAPSGFGWNAHTGALLVGNGNVDGSDPLAWGDLLGAAALGGNANIPTFGLEPIVQVRGSTVGAYPTALFQAAGSTAGLQGDQSIQAINVLGGPLAMTPAVVSALAGDLAAG